MEGEETPERDLWTAFRVQQSKSQGNWETTEIVTTDLSGGGWGAMRVKGSEI